MIQLNLPLSEPDIYELNHVGAPYISAAKVMRVLAERDALRTEVFNLRARIRELHSLLEDKTRV